MPRKLFSIAAGTRFGRLTAVSPAGPDRHGKKRWRFRCDCGGRSIALVGNVAGGRTRSCGCLRDEVIRRSRNVKHGKSWSPEYFSWRAMLARCLNPKATGYERYGGAGIRVCKRWLTFENFFADMGKRPPGTSLDRRNNKGHYKPGNVRWASKGQQSNNQRTNRLVRFRGKRMSLAKACAAAGLGYHTVHRRIAAYGWTIKRALSTPIASRRR